jgi:hypothetical protein
MQVVTPGKPNPTHPSIEGSPSRATEGTAASLPIEAVFELLCDVASYRNRRQEVLRGRVTTAAASDELLALEQRLRGSERDDESLFAFQRSYCSVPAVLALGSDGPHLAVHVSTLSAGGAVVCEQSGLRVGQRIELSLTIPGPCGIVTFDFHGRVSWVWNRMAGLMFAGCVESSPLYREVDFHGALVPVLFEPHEDLRTWVQPFEGAAAEPERALPLCMVGER